MIVVYNYYRESSKKSGGQVVVLFWIVRMIVIFLLIVFGLNSEVSVRFDEFLWRRGKVGDSQSEKGITVQKEKLAVWVILRTAIRCIVFEGLCDGKRILLITVKYSIYK